MPRPTFREAVAEAAGQAGLSPIGLWSRTAIECVRALPALRQGEQPARLKLKFIALPAMAKVLSARLGRARALELLMPIFRIAARSAIGSRFRGIDSSSSIVQIGEAHIAGFRTLGRYQEWRMEASSDDVFRFVVTECRFVKALAELGVGEFAPLMCEADRLFWEETLSGSDIAFSKAHETIARGGAFCRTSFHAPQGQPARVDLARRARPRTCEVSR